MEFGWATLFLFLVVAPILSLLFGTAIGTWIRKNGDSVEALVARVRNDSNAQYVDQLIRYHNNRIMAGASDEESLARLVQELKEVEQGTRG